MAFVAYCDNKGCMKQMEPLLDKKTNEVFCTECGKTINNLTHFAKISLRDMGQIKRTSENKEAFALECKGCKQLHKPRLQNNKPICVICGKEYENVTSSFIQMLKTL